MGKLVDCFQVMDILKCSRKTLYNLEKKYFLSVTINHKKCYDLDQINAYIQDKLNAKLKKERKQAKKSPLSFNGSFVDLQNYCKENGITSDEIINLPEPLNVFEVLKEPVKKEPIPVIEEFRIKLPGLVKTYAEVCKLSIHERNAFFLNGGVIK